MKTTSRWSDFVRAQMRGSQQELSERSGASPSSLSRWLKGKPPSPQEAISFARAVGGTPIQALLLAGYITAAEANMVAPDLNLETIDEIVLLDELKRRAILRIS